LIVFRVPLKRIALHESLSDAEREVAVLALAGLSNSEIGRRRGTSGRTVANQMATIFRKLGVSSRTELALNVVVKGG
jgi:DNA-binding CsgD family transcriptional regulator